MVIFCLEVMEMNSLSVHNHIFEVVVSEEGFFFLSFFFSFFFFFFFFADGPIEYEEFLTRSFLPIDETLTTESE